MNRTNRIVDGMTEFKISPKDIDTKNHFWAFGDSRTNVAAGYIIGLCQSKVHRGRWLPFNPKEVEDLYHEWGHNKAFHVGNLLIDGWIVVIDDVCFLTEEFIWECYKASQATEQTDELAQRITNKAKDRIRSEKLLTAA